MPSTTHTTIKHTLLVLCLEKVWPKSDEHSFDQLWYTLCLWKCVIITPLVQSFDFEGTWCILFWGYLVYIIRDNYPLSSNLSILRVPGVYYSRNASCALNLIYTIVLLSLGRYLCWYHLTGSQWFDTSAGIIWQVVSGSTPLLVSFDR
jgi:hypothetical protein